MKYKVYGRVFTDIARYPVWDNKKEFPHYDMESEHVWEVEFSSLQEAERWLANNHPEYYMGGSIVCDNGDFLMLSVPSGEYGSGNYETKNARAEFVKRLFA